MKVEMEKSHPEVDPSTGGLVGDKWWHKNGTTKEFLCVKL